MTNILNRQGSSRCCGLNAGLVIVDHIRDAGIRHP